MLTIACGGSNSAESEVSRDEVDALKATTQLTPAEIFVAVAPSVVFVEVPDGSASGVLLSNGYVVTNAHVVGPYPTVRLFTFWGEVTDVPVYAKDWSTDLALIGPLRFDELGEEISVAVWGSSATMATGDGVYLIGYPGEVETEPVPAMTSGILSRRRVAPCLGMSFLQTDAMLASGQSGGVLVDASGRVIGISGLGGFADTNFGLVLTVEDVLAALEGLDEGSGRLVMTESEGSLTQSFEVPINDSVGYLVEITKDQPFLAVSASSADGEDIWLDIKTWDGLPPRWHWGQGEVDYIYDDIDARDEVQHDFFFADAFDDGTAESLEVSLEPGIYVVAIGAYSYSPTTVSVEASSYLTLLKDLETPFKKLVIGKSVTGALNHYEDVDNYHVDLQKGDTVRIQMFSIADPMMSLYLGDELVASNDDASIGLYGYGAEIVFEANAGGLYDLAVTANSNFAKTYVLSLDHADIGSPSC